MNNLIARLAPVASPTSREGCRAKRELSPTWLPVAAALAVVLLLGYAPAHGQSVEPLASLDVAVDVAANDAPDLATSLATPLRYGMPAPRRPLPEFVYPIKAETYGVEGQVVVRFTVSKTGKAKDVKVLKTPGYGCDDEVLRVLRSARFEPVRGATGEPQPTPFVMAVDFRLDS